MDDMRREDVNNEKGNEGYKKDESSENANNLPILACIRQINPKPSKQLQKAIF